MPPVGDKNGVFLGGLLTYILSYEGIFSQLAEGYCCFVVNIMATDFAS